MESLQSGTVRLEDALTAWSDATDGGTESVLDLLRAAEQRLADSPESTARDSPESTNQALWHRYLDKTADPDFLERLPDPAARERWAASAFLAIRRSGYTLKTLFDQRVASHPGRLLFRDIREPTTPEWTYAQTSWHLRRIASAIRFVQSAPRVAVFSENNIDSACADLACLVHGIFVTPLNVHFDADTIAWIFDRLGINVVVTDSDSRLRTLADVHARIGRPFSVFLCGGSSETAQPIEIRGLPVTPLRPACARVDPADTVDRPSDTPVDLMSAATVMFTSGSTGHAKGVVFSLYNLVSKRFARGAALPGVGRQEVLLCYLPLFHTFGRFFELLGTIYWRGTYVFATGPTAEALMADLGRVRPTGLVSVPLRWTQIRESCLDAAGRTPDPTAETEALRNLVGNRLRWGISAAGFLDPLVFRFFQRHGIDLCSGFGMTEATGGITMTPPNAYVDGTVGLPLPGMRIRFGAQGELQIAGPYVTRYLDDQAPSGCVPPVDPDADHWIATGDLFRQRPGGYLEIVDRIKDIYKNSRGQTIAPQRVEQRFASVPGIRRTFVAGDHRDFNVLLIVLDRDDPVLADRTEEDLYEYLGQIVASVNRGLAPYERVVRFAIIDRDFEHERHEITPKGSLRRKVIAEHFHDVIDRLYSSNHVELSVGNARVRIPRWFFRDLAVLEDDVVARKDGLHNKRTGAFLTIVPGVDGTVRVGDLVYRVSDSAVDLGQFARQPRLWIGNPSLARFSPCKTGWDLPQGGVADQLRLPSHARHAPDQAAFPAWTSDDERARELHALSIAALFGPNDEASAAIDGLAAVLARADARTASLIRRRFEALAYHPDEDIRVQAYRILVLDEPGDDYDEAFPAFVDSGLTFLNDRSIATIASAGHGELRLQALRRRLHRYRSQLDWPGSPIRLTQFTRVFKLLADFARHDRDSFPAVESELACWALLREDPALARSAQKELDLLTAWYQDTLVRSVVSRNEADPPGRIVFEFGVPPAARTKLLAVLSDPTFLMRSLTHAFDEHRFDWSQVAGEGVWVSPIQSHHLLDLYRVAINLKDGKHFDLLLVVGEGLRNKRAVADTVLWMTALAGHAFGTPALPRLGAWRKDLGAAAVAYVHDATAWERIRELSRDEDVRDAATRRWLWRKLFVRAMAAFFRAWDHSGGRIVPGALAPGNVAVPDADFHEGATIISLAGWHPYEGPLPFVELLVRNFYLRTEAHYPNSRETLQVDWIFDACIEALGPARAAKFFDDLQADLKTSEHSVESEGLDRALAVYLAALERRPYVPLPVICAIHRFLEWEHVTATPSAGAREEAVIQMMHLYRLDRFEDTFRYYLYQHTYFTRADPRVGEIFDRLTGTRAGGEGEAPRRLEELSQLQGLMIDQDDREAFSRMVFPQSRKTDRMELLQVGAAEEARVIVRSIVRDQAGTSYQVREPITPLEVGQLYRLIRETDYPKRIDPGDRHVIIADRNERIVGGLCYRWQESRAVYVDSIVVSGALLNQGLGGSLVEDFCVRMAAQGARCVKTNFFLAKLFSKHGFSVNERWGGLVRFLNTSEPSRAEHLA